MTDRLRPLWDFGDLDRSEQRLRDQLAAETSDAGRAEVLTQLARVEGLRGDFGTAEELLDQALALVGASEVAAARVDLERGRARRSSGRREAALPLFESAFRRAVKARHFFVAADAAHMAALAAADRDGFVAWTQRGIDLADEHEGASYWLGPLLNNLGWEFYDSGEHDLALDAFERALRVRERDADNEEGIALARYAVGKTLRALGRSQEAIPLVEQAAAWATARGAPDGWFHEELAEEYAAVGQLANAARHASRALDLLPAADPAFTAETQRAVRLRALSAHHA